MKSERPAGGPGAGTTEVLEVHTKWNTWRRRVSIPSSGIQAADVALPPKAPNEIYFHEDLHELDVETLRALRRRLGLAILISMHVPSWSLQRFARIERELKARSGR
jgi:hypothetical protein